MPGGSTKRQCPHCLEKSNCANRRCTKCGKMLELKPRHTARMKDFRQNAKDWAQKVHWSRNQSKIFDNSVLMVEKLKALGYFPLLFWGKYHNKNKKWTAQLQCPFELPLVAHAVLEKMVCLFEGFLEERELLKYQQKRSEARKNKTRRKCVNITANWTRFQCNLCQRHVKGCKEVLVHWLPCPAW
ncbi:uncharacterized protein isoform X4 [Notothenia coriiceps]|uniref:Uncharacterized protein isoform X4 n=1 Tax=Notothenia coriiceps TaxID=8208 RepID=A0A6I9N2D7_9TELE|nr:PREDICTED: uncharacterized protein LOC104947713 isoform X4 [Notothenia coriiceps]